MRRGVCRVAVLAVAALAAGRARAEEPVLDRCLVSVIDKADVPAGEAGLLVELAIREGDSVTEGEKIAKIDDSQPQSEMDRATAEHAQAVAKAESDVDVRFAIEAEKLASLDLQKAEKVHSAVKGATTDLERAEKRLAWEKTKLQIEQAQFERQQAKLAAASKKAEVDAATNGMRRRLIKSPLDGIVVQVFPHRGEWMQPNDPVARVVRTDRLKVEGFVKASTWDPDRIRDRPVTVQATLAGDRRETFPGRIVFVSPLDESGGDYRVVAEVENRRGEASQQWLLRAGKTVTMTVHSDKPPLPPERK